MRKVFRYLRSMRFGLLLLGLIGLCSVIGTVIPQGREIAWYAQTYRSFHGVILLLRLNRIFESPYFIALLILLCLNLSLCSLLRIRTVVTAAKTETQRAARAPDTVLLTPEGAEKLRQYLTDMRCKSETIGEATVWRKHGIGRYGTFVTHLSILLTVVFGALALYTPTVVDRDCMPGESIFLDDGTEIHVHDFRIADETGRLDYQSRVQVTLPDGRQSEVAELKVNHPFSFGAYKLFQQTFGTTGSVTVTDPDGSEFVSYIKRGDVLMLDDRNRLVIDTLYPDYAMSPDGEIVFDTVTTGVYPNPIYTGLIIADGERTPFYALPGQALTLGGARFTFNAPVDYPGIRVKHVSPHVNALLVGAFALMIAGLYLTFFLEPVLVKTDAEGCAVLGPKPERMRVELGEELREYERQLGGGGFAAF
jgi:cytochrome c biogenesis protein